MKWSELAEKLRADHPDLHCTTETDAHIYSAAILGSERAHFSEHCVYIALNHEAAGRKAAGRPLNTIVAESQHVSLQHADRNVIAVSDGKAESLLSEVTQILEADNAEKQILSELYGFISKDKYLEPLMDRAFEWIGNPISYYDYSHKIISYRISDPVDNAIWKANIEDGLYDYSTLHETFYTDVDRVTRQRSPFLIQLLNDRCLTCSVMYNNNLIGFISAIEAYRPIQDIDFKIIRAVADVIAVKSVKDHLAGIEDDYVYKNIFKDLIEGSITTEHEFKARLGTQIWKQKPMKRIIAVDVSHNASDAYISYRKNRFTYIYPHIKIVSHKQYMVLIEEFNDEAELAFHEQIADFITESNLKAGVSNVFADILQLKEYYGQAQKALYYQKLLHSERHISNYAEYQFIDFINECNSKMNAEEYYHPILQQLEAYDQKNNTELGKTAFTYLDNDKSIADTAEKMHLHKNTINYRINRIKELVQVDLTNYQEVLHIVLSYKLKNSMELGKSIK